MTEELKADKGARKALNARLRRAFGFERQDTYPPEVTQLVKAARAVEKKANGIMADVSSAQNSRQGASEWMVEDDREFRKELRDNFEALAAALASYKEVE